MHPAEHHSRLMTRLGRGQSCRAHDVDAIVAHLQILLNAHKGTAPASPEYGLADLLPLLRALPESRPALCERLRSTIAAFEPRLANIRVTQTEADDASRVQFHISATLRRNDTSIALTTCVMGNEYLRVSA